MDLVERLAAHKAVGGAPREELEWLVAHGTLRLLAPGDVLSTKGKPVEGLFLILTGHIAIYLDRGAGRNKVMEWRAGDVAGVLPYSRLVSPPGDSVAQEPTEIFAIPRGDLSAMIRDCHEITSLLVHKMLDRSRAFVSTGLQDEKMLSLGKLSAGLAHELNNPVSAIARNASLLGERLDDAEGAARAMSVAHLTEAQLGAIESLRASCLASAGHGHTLTPIERARREAELEDWLDDHDVDADLAGPLSETAVTIDTLDRVAQVLEASPSAGTPFDRAVSEGAPSAGARSDSAQTDSAPSDRTRSDSSPSDSARADSARANGATLAAVLRWVAAGCVVREIASEIHDAARRISGLVKAIKGFTHMDQAVVAGPVDLTSSLDHTIAVLNSKAKQKSIAVSLNVASDLPPVRGFAGELNQIWANLIDNALDAAPEHGAVEVAAARERENVVVRVIDNGPGISAEVRARMFDPFFTTKPVGQGTGLGLDIVRRLLVHNDAEIDVESAPGRTVFKITLPFDDPS